MRKYFDVKPKSVNVNFRQIGEEEEVTMCGFRSEQEMAIALGVMLAIIIIAICR